MKLIDWIIWNLYAYKISLIICIFISILHYVDSLYKYEHSMITQGGILISIFVGFCLWCVYIVFDQGYGIG